MRRLRHVVGLLALVAVAVLLLRPITLDAMGAPFGAHASPEVQLAKAEGSPHCSLLADCETVSISNVGLDLAQGGIAVMLAGLVLAVFARETHPPRSWTALVPNPPPLFALG